MQNYLKIKIALYSVTALLLKIPRRAKNESLGKERTWEKNAPHKMIASHVWQI